jgi:hypothetical protein
MCRGQLPVGRMRNKVWLPWVRLNVKFYEQFMEVVAWEEEGVMQLPRTCRLMFLGDLSGVSPVYCNDSKVYILQVVAERISNRKIDSC